jgi:hypothetical protein
VFINHSNSPSLSAFHGRAIRLFPNDSRLPFHGAFLVHEVRVRGHYPFAADSILRLPIEWQSWTGLAPDDDGGDNGHDDGDDDNNYSNDGDGGDDNLHKTGHADMQGSSNLTKSMVHMSPTSGYYSEFPSDQIKGTCLPSTSRPTLRVTF